MQTTQMQQTTTQRRWKTLGASGWLRVSLFLVSLLLALFSYFSVNQTVLATPTGGITALDDHFHGSRAGLDDFPVLPVPEMAVTGNGVIINDGANAPSVIDDTDFGDGGVGGLVITHTFTISNVGNAELQLAGPSVVKMENGTHFSVLSQPVSTTLQGGEAMTFVVAFNPEAAGAFTDTVRIASIVMDDNGNRDDIYFTFVVGGIGLQCPSGAVIYVDMDDSAGVNNGTSWVNAFTSLQDALYRSSVICPAVDQIWVAEGIYRPGSSDALSATFHLQNGLSVYGGFAGTESDLAERNWTTNVTVLTGDIDANDVTDANGVVTSTTQIVGSNSFHVVTGSGTDNTALLDGFTISAGQADNSFVCPDGCGGGMYNSGGSPTLNHIVFSGNKALYGGGSYNEDGRTAMNHVSFLGNSASDGGGMYNSDHSSPVLDSVIFSGNSAEAGGGGMVNDRYSSPTLTNVTFDSNSADYGGGMENYEYSNPTLTHVVFSDNRADYGGGIYNEYASSPALTHTTFSSNSAVEEGGGMYNYDESSPRLTNVTFHGNRTDGMGGGMGNDFNSRPTLKNVTFSDNSAANGSGLYNHSDSNLTIQNSIFWNSQEESRAGTPVVSIYNDSSSSPIISYSLVQGSGGSGAWNYEMGADAGHNVDADPLLGVLGNYNPASATGLATQTVPLLPGSAAIGAAGATACPATDQRGISRPVGSACDMGAFESQGFSLAISGGDDQVTIIGTDFVVPLSILVTSSYTEPVDGGVVTFIGPGNGASTAPKSQTATIASGAAAATITANSVYGAYTVTANSAGALAGSKFSLRNVSPSTITLANVPNPSIYGASVTFTATVNAAATGVVTFSTGAGNLGIATLSSGVAAFSTSSLTGGSHVVTATYGGDVNFLGSVSSPVTQTVNFIPTAVNDAAGVLEGESVDVAVLANDLDPAGEGLTMIGVGVAGKGTASINADNSTVHYIAPADVSGVDSFSYTVHDTNGNTSTGMVIVAITAISETNGAPQVAVIDPVVQNTRQFTSTQGTVTVDMPAGAMTVTPGIADVFFLSYTPIVTPTEQTQHTPGLFQFGNIQFNLTAFLNDVPQQGIQFAHPVTLTVVYDPALMNGLNLETLGLYYWNGTAWTTDGIVIIDHDIPNSTVTVTISHLSDFAFFAAPTSLLFLPIVVYTHLPPENGLFLPIVMHAPIIIHTPLQAEHSLFLPTIGW